MGAHFSRLGPYETVEVFWKQRKTRVLKQLPLSEEELDELIYKFQWVCFSYLTDPSSEKSHLISIMVGIKYYKGWKVLWV